MDGTWLKVSKSWFDLKCGHSLHQYEVSDDNYGDLFLPALKIEGVDQSANGIIVLRTTSRSYEMVGDLTEIRRAVQR